MPLHCRILPTLVCCAADIHTTTTTANRKCSCTFALDAMTGQYILWYHFISAVAEIVVEKSCPFDPCSNFVEILTEYLQYHTSTFSAFNTLVHVPSVPHDTLTALTRYLKYAYRVSNSPSQGISSTLASQGWVQFSTLQGNCSTKQGTVSTSHETFL